MRKLLEKMGYYPRNGVWEITLRCNLRCLHCGSEAGGARGEELSHEEALNMVDQLAGIGLQQMTLSGGEPLLRKDWPDIAARMTEKGIDVNLITNGLLVNEEVIDRAREAGLKNLVFSFDGDRKLHDHIRNLPGAYDRLLRAWELCREKDYPFSVVSHVNKLTVEILDEMYQTIRDKGGFAWQIQLGSPMGNFQNYPEYQIMPADLLEVIPRMSALIRHVRAEGKVGMYVADCTGYYGPYEEDFRQQSPLGFWFGCVAGCQIIGVEANGNIKGCLTMQDPDFVVGNVRERPLQEIWEDDNNFAFNRKFEVDDLQGFCRECEYGDICRAGCKWHAHLSTGTLGENLYCYHRIATEKEEGVDITAHPIHCYLVAQGKKAQESQS